MIIPLYHVDAFTEHPFEGNPAAVCPLEMWPPDALLQKIARENNLSETAFFVPAGDGFELRWFTPKVEVELCGHATLATAHLLLHRLEPGRDRVAFSTRSGRLEVARDGDLLAMDFPAYPPEPVDAPAGLFDALGHDAEAVLRGNYLMVVVRSEWAVRALEPDFAAMDRASINEAIVTARGSDCDFVSRFFAPGFGVPEDPVTGSAHCSLVPYWAHRLGRTRLQARQVSQRGGELACELRGNRVSIAGRAVMYLEGEIELP